MTIDDYKTYSVRIQSITSSSVLVMRFICPPCKCLEVVIFILLIELALMFSCTSEDEPRYLNHFDLQDTYQVLSWVGNADVSGYTEHNTRANRGECSFRCSKDSCKD